MQSLPRPIADPNPRQNRVKMPQHPRSKLRSVKGGLGTKTDLGYKNTWYYAMMDDKIGLANVLCFNTSLVLWSRLLSQRLQLQKRPPLVCVLSLSAKQKARSCGDTYKPLCRSAGSRQAARQDPPFQDPCAGDEMNPGPLDGWLPALSVGTTSSPRTAEWKAVLGTK